MGKRANGEGCYYKLKSGNWVGQIMDGYKPDGKKNIISVTAPTKGEAMQKIRDYLRDKNSAPSQVTQPVSFDTWSDIWYADYQTQVQPSTYANYHYTLQTLKKHFGSTPIQEITLVDINAYAH